MVCAGASARLAGKPFPCGCGKDWGCVEAYTTISGLPYLLAEKIVEISKPRTREIHCDDQRKSSLAPQPRAKGRRAGVGNLDFQARVMGLHVANLSMALDPGLSSSAAD